MNACQKKEWAIKLEKIDSLCAWQDPHRETENEALENKK